jgi:ubiquinone/menaquinone biosynthesis C-methylase UbiE
MTLAETVLYQLARRWPSPMERVTRKLGAEPGTYEYNMAYARNQFNTKVRSGLMVEVWDKEVLEIGCGHGGITAFIAVAGAKRAVGIDLNETHLAIAREFAAALAERYGRPLPVEYAIENATASRFAEASFDVVMADNVFEHFTEPEAVLREAFRVLRPGGVLVVPVFSSILSKYGLHLKHGLKMPWANIVFSEKTILRVLARLAEDDPKLHTIYPGLAGSPQAVRDVRRYRDLNDITYAKFQQMAVRVGFTVTQFSPHAYLPGRIARKLPGLKNSVLVDVCSTGATALLTKPRNAS